MTKKERTIKACRELAAKYRAPEGKTFFALEVCPLCTVHADTVNECHGCPLALMDGDEGCYQFNSNERAFDYYEETDIIAPNPAFNARAAFFDKIIPILEGIPASRFTKRGWRYFDMLDWSW